MIWSFICSVCNKYKTNGRPDTFTGKWVCVDCLNEKVVKNDKGKINR